MENAAILQRRFRRYFYGVIYIMCMSLIETRL